MSEEIQYKVTYMVYCVSAFANHHGLNNKQAYSYLKLSQSQKERYRIRYFT